MVNRLVKNKDGMRAAQRYETRERLVIEYLDEASGIQGLGEGRDLSSVGVRFIALHRLVIGKLLNLTLHFPSAFPGSKHVTLAAKVIRIYKPKGTRHFRVGCEFLSDQTTSREAVHQYLFWMESRS